MENSRIKIAPNLCKSINFWLEKKRTFEEYPPKFIATSNALSSVLQNNSKNGKRSGISNYCKVHYLLLLAK